MTDTEIVDDILTCLKEREDSILVASYSDDSLIDVEGEDRIFVRKVMGLLGRRD